MAESRNHFQSTDVSPLKTKREGYVKQPETQLRRLKTTVKTTSCDVLRRDVEEMKKDLALVKSTQRDILNEVKENREQIARMTTAIDNLTSSIVTSVCSKIVVIGGRADKVSSSVEKFNFSSQTWTPLAELRTPRYSFAAVVFQNKILVSGGATDDWLNDCKDSIDVLDLNDYPPEWKKFPANLPIKVACHQCVVYGNRLLIFGGTVDGDVAFDTIYELLLVPPYSSKLLCRMKKKRACLSVELFDDKVLIADIEENVELFDITRNECMVMPKLPSPVVHITTVRRDDSMLIIGDVCNKVFQYDYKTGKSEVLLDMKTKLIGGAALYLGNMLVIFGGAKDSRLKNPVNEVNCYNFLSNSWIKLPSMSERRIFSSALIVNRF